jgi:hypothetical protein
MYENRQCLNNVRRLLDNISKYGPVNQRLCHRFRANSGGTYQGEFSMLEPHDQPRGFLQSKTTDSRPPSSLSFASSLTSKASSTSDLVEPRRIPTDSTPYACFTCGMTTHTRKDCPHIKERDVNFSKLPWAASEIGKLWLRAGYSTFSLDVSLRECPETTAARYASRSLRYEPLSTEQRLEDRSVGDTKTTAGTTQHRSDRDRDSRPDRDRDRDLRGDRDRDYRKDRDRAPRSDFRDTDRDRRDYRTSKKSKAFALFLASLCSTSTSHYIPAHIFLAQKMSRPGATTADKLITSPPPNAVAFHFLMDTGASAGDFISGDILARLRGADYVYRTPKPIIVRGALNSESFTTYDMLDIAFHFYTSKDVAKIVRLSVSVKLMRCT